MIIPEKKFIAANRQMFISEAPVVIVCCAETDGYMMACGQQCYPIDVAIAIDHLKEKEIGYVSNCFSQISVAAVEITNGKVSVGDALHFRG